MPSSRLPAASAVSDPALQGPGPEGNGHAAHEPAGPVEPQHQLVLDRLADLGRRLLGVPAVLAAIEEGGQMTVASASGPDAAIRDRAFLLAFCSRVAVEGHLLTGEAEGMACLATPLRTPDGRAVGALCAVDAAPRTWTEADRAALAELAELASAEVAARENFRASREARRAAEAALREQAQTFELLTAVTTRIASELDLQRLIQSVTDAATGLTGARFGAFFYNVLNEQGESYTLYTLSGVEREAFDGFPMPRNTEVFGPTFRGEAVVRSDDITKDPRYGKNAPYRGLPEGHLPVRSYLAVPVVSRSGEVHGGLFFGHPEVGVFGEQAERVAVGIAAQAAVAIDNARLFEAAEREIDERRRVEEALRVSETRFRALFHGAADAMIVYALNDDGPGLIEEVNDVAVARYGYSREEFLEMYPVGLLDTSVVDHSAIIARLRRERRLITESRHITKDGRKLPVEVSLHLIEFAGHPAVLTVSRDITERKALERDRALLAAIVQSSDDAIISKTLEGIITSWNAGAERIFGYTAAETVGQSILMLIPPERHEEEHMILGRLRRGERIDHFETVRVAKDGRRLHISLTVSPIRDGSGRIVGASKVARDVTFQKEAEAALRHSEERFRNLIRRLPAAVYTTDLDGRITLYNDRAVELWGRHPEVGRDRWCGSVRMYWPDGTPLLHEDCLVARLLQGDTPVRGQEVIIERPDGTRAWTLPHPEPLRDASGEIVGAVNMLVDVTDRKEAELALRQRERQQAVVAELGHLALRHLRPDSGPLDALMDRLAAVVAETLEVEFCKVLELLPDGEHLYLRAGVGWRDGLVRQATVPSAAGSQAGYALRSDEPVAVEDLRTDSRFEEPALLLEHGVVSGLSCVIPDAEGTAWGVLGVHTTRQRAFSRDDAHFLQAVANLLGAAIGRKRAEEALQESEERFRTMADSVPVLIWLADPDGRCEYFSAGWLAFTGRPMEEELGDGWLEGVHPDDRDDCLRSFSAAVEARAPFEMEFRLRRHDGEYRWVVDRGVPRFAPEGPFLGYIGTSIDIHDRKQAEARTRFLADAGALLDRSLDFEATLNSVASIAVPDFSDWCAVDLLDEGGSLRRLAVAHVDPEKVRWAEEIQERYPTNLDAPYGAGQVLRTGTSELYRDVSDELIAAVAQDDEHLAILRAVGFRSVIIVPLRAGEQVIGILSFIASQSEKRFDESDLAVAEELGRRAGTIILSAQLHAAVRESAERLRAVIDTAVDGIITIDERGRIESFNPAAVKIFGYEPEEVLGRNVSMLMPEPYHSEHDTYLRSYLETGRRRVIGIGREVQGRRKDGSTFPLDLAVSETHLEGRRIFTGLVRDITQRKKVEQALRESEARFRQLAEALPQIVYTLDARTGETLYLNPRWYDYTGLPEGTSYAAAMAEVIHPDDLEQVNAAWAEAAAKGETFAQELRLRRRDGVYRWFITRAVPVHDAEGHIVRWFGTSTDIHAQKEIEAELETRVAERTEELQRSNQELDQFAYVASHDLKAPLRAIDNLASWIVEDAQEVLPDPSKRHLDLLQGRVRRMERLLDDLLAYSRAGRDMGGREEIDTAALVEDIVELLDLPDGFAVEIAPDLPRIVSPRAPLEMVFRNLVANAVKHHHQREGRIRVSAAAAERPGYVAFSVADDGPGIAPEYHERIFGLFQTLRPRDEVEGSGMGLAAVKKAVEARGGTIRVQSAPGAGATFTFSWPRSAQPLSREL